jgi:hypothetical protein
VIRHIKLSQVLTFFIFEFLLFTYSLLLPFRCFLPVSSGQPRAGICFMEVIVGNRNGIIFFPDNSLYHAGLRQGFAKCCLASNKQE